MKHALAVMIQVAAGVIGVELIGVAARGPFADPSIPRDLAAGGAIVGAMAALAWSARELEGAAGER